MMAFFDQLKAKATLASEKVVETANSVISDQQQNAEIRRRKAEIRTLQAQIDDLFRLIGVRVFDVYENSTDAVPDVQEEITRIKHLFSQQLKIQASLKLENDMVWQCETCSEVVAASHQFCPSCGNVKG